MSLLAGLLLSATLLACGLLQDFDPPTSGDQDAAPSSERDAGAVDCAATAEGQLCAIGDAGLRYLCLSGECSPSRCGDGWVDTEGGEACDDANGSWDDGCDPACRISCREDEDCDDGDRCNGSERCTEDEGCVEGDGEDALVCGDSDSCIERGCDPSEGCFERRFDEDGDGHWRCVDDCDDEEETVYDGAPELCDGLDNNCDGSVDEGLGRAATCFWDLDSDGWGDDGAPLELCMCSEDHVAVGGDCFDHPLRGDLVFPGQETCFEIPLCTYCDLPFDYDCDGEQEACKDELFSSCGGPRCEGEGWRTEIPACGETGSYVRCVMSDGSCTRERETRTQSCR